MNALGTYSIFHFDVFFKVNPITTIDSLYFACFLIGWTDNSFKKRNIENENKRHENNKIIIYILPQSTIDGWPSNNPSNSAKKKKKSKTIQIFLFRLFLYIFITIYQQVRLESPTFWSTLSLDRRWNNIHFSKICFC